MSREMSKRYLASNLVPELREACKEAETALLNPEPLANVLGLGIGIKWSKGRASGKPAIIALVSHKLAKTQLAKRDLIPKKLSGYDTDVLAIGYPFAGAQIPSEAQTLARRTRPVQGGYSVGHKDITAGTMATAVYDIQAEGSTNPPEIGIGIPNRYYMLSNNHVLANSNKASIGDPILQPGPFDGGQNPADRIATLSRYVPIEFDPQIPKENHMNLVDAAIAEADFADIDRSVYWNGQVQAWWPKDKLTVGSLLKKTGRTTHFTTGRVTVLNATVDVNYDGGQVARFRDQIITTPMSEGGDSGSLMLSLNNAAVGLLFAGSTQATIANHIEDVRSLLRIEIAEQLET